MKNVHIREILFVLVCIDAIHHSNSALIRTFIVGGSSSQDATQFPYQVSLRRYSSHICGGAIVSANYVLTAAHCVTVGTTIFAAKDLSVRVGSTFTSTGGLVRSISQVIAHNQYAFPINDIALLKLSSALTYTTRIRAIPLAVSALAAGTVLTASGWGYTSTNGVQPLDLQYVLLTALSNAECTRIYGSMTSSIACLQSPQGQGICQGDSGGPAAYDGRLYGLASFTPDTCGGTYPDGFTIVHNFLTWIAANSDVTV